MPSNKKLKDLEYNVFKKDLETESGQGLSPKNAGCMTMLAGIMVTILIIVMIVGFMQIGSNGPAVTCAAPGCSNRPKGGSSYCWLHSASKTGGGKKSGASKDKSSDETEKDKEAEKKNSKIWSGNTREDSGGSRGNASSGGSKSTGGGGSITD